MSNETTVFLNQGDTVVVKVRTASPIAPFDESVHQEGLGQYRRFVQTHFEQIGYLLGGKPEDQDSLLMDAERQLPYLITALRHAIMTPEEVVSFTADALRSSPNWSQSDVVAGDMAECLVNLLSEVAKGIPKK